MDHPITFAKPRAKHSLGGVMLRALLIALFSFALLLFVCAYIAYGSADPTALLRPMAYGITLAVSLIFGFAAAKIRGRQGLLCGGLAGLTMLLLLTVGLLATMDEGGFSPERLLPAFLLAAALAVLGGVLGCLRREKRRRPRHR